MADIDAVDGNRLPSNYNKKETEPLSTQWEGRPALTFSPCSGSISPREGASVYGVPAYRREGIPEILDKGNLYHIEL